MEEKFGLTLIPTDTGEGLILKNYETLKEDINKILESNPTYIITDNSQLKEAKNFRAKLNKTIKNIDRMRIDAITDLTSTFTKQCNELVDLIDKKQKEIGKEVKTYEDSKKLVIVETKTKIIATLKFFDEKLIKKITEFAEKNDCELSIN